MTEFVFLRRGEGQEWNQGGLIQGQGFENVREETYIWYGTWDPGSLEPRGGVGLATTDHGSIPAAFMSSAIRSSRPAKLWVNAKGVSADSTLKLELLDDLERPLAGYSGEEAC